MEKKAQILGILKNLILMYAVTGILLLILTVLLWKFQLGEQFVSGAIIGVYAICGFIGGLLIGKKQQTKKLFWGMLMGFLYFLVLTVGSLLIQKDDPIQMQSFLTTLIMCVASAMVGGMVA